MKKVFLLVLSVLMVFGLVACKRNNPPVVKESEPVLSGVESKTIAWGSEFDPMAGVKATDEVDGDITSQIKIEGTVDTFRSIQHVLVYTVTNSQGKEARAMRQITVDYATEEDMANLIAKNDPTRTLKYEYSKKNFYNVDFSIDGNSLEGGVEGWQSWGAGGNYSVHDGMIQVNVGTEYYQISNNENILKAGQYYIVSFEARADQKQEDKSLEFTFRAIWGTEANGGWDDHTIKYWEDKPITTTWQTYYFLFKAKTDEENCLCLITQGIRNTVYYKNICIYEVNPTSDPLNIPEEVDTNYDLSSDNAEYWDKFSLDDNGTFTVAENKLTINVKDVYLQVANHRNKLERGKSYKLEFDIKSSVALTGGGYEDENGEHFMYRVIVGSEETGWTPDNVIYPVEDLAAGEVTHIVCYFTPKYATKNVYCYVFQGFTGTVEISNISVEQAAKPVDPTESDLGTNWGFWSGDTAEKLFEVENQVVTYNPTSAIPYYQISNNGNNLVKGQKYVISFDLTPETELAAGAFKFIYGDENGGWHPSVDSPTTEAIAAGTEAHLSFEFTCTSDTANAFCFIFMNYGSSAVLKNFEIEVDEAPVESDLGTNWGFWSGDTAEKLFDVQNQIVTYRPTFAVPYYQISNNGNVLENGKTYVISFDLTPEAELAAGAFKFIYGDENGGWHPSVDLPTTEAIAAGTEAHLSFEFTCTSDTANAFCFIFMNYGSNAVLKNFEVEEKGSTPQPEPEIAAFGTAWGFWSGDTADKLFEVANQVVTYNTATAIPYYQISNNENELEANKTYIISFDLTPKADLAAGQFKFLFGSEANGWAEISQSVLNEAVAANAKKSLSFEITAPAAEHNVYCFIFMGYQGEAVLENFKVEEKPETPAVEKANLTLDFMDGTVGSGYTNANWKQEYSTQSGWTNASGNMNCREKDGVRVVNVVSNNNCAYRYTYSDGENSLGLANKLSFKYGNYFSPNQPILVKIALVDKDGNDHYILGEDGITTESFVRVDTTTGLVDQVIRFDELEVYAIRIMVTGTSSSYQYLYVGNMQLTWTDEVPQPEPEIAAFGTAWGFWSGDTADKLFEVANQVVTYNTATAIPYYQISNNENELEANKTYIISFDLTPKADLAAGQFKFLFGSEANGWAEISQSVLNEAVAANAKKSLSFEITAPAAEHNVYCFIFMNYQGEAVLENFKVEERPAFVPTLGTNWGFWSGDTADKLFEVADQVVTYNAATPIPYYQISNNGNALENGKTYRIFFDLTPAADLAAGAFKFIYGDENGGWHPSVDLATTEAILAGATKSLYFDFVCTSDTANAYCFIFMNYQGEAVLKNFRIVEKPAAKAVVPNAVNASANYVTWNDAHNVATLANLAKTITGSQWARWDYAGVEDLGYAKVTVVLHVTPGLKVMAKLDALSTPANNAYDGLAGNKTTLTALEDGVLTFTWNLGDFANACKAAGKAYDLANLQKFVFFACDGTGNAEVMASATVELVSITLE